MELLLKIAIIVHVSAGAIALLAGIAAIMAKKGKKIHLLTGKIYFWAMTIIFITAMFLSVYKTRWFLFFIGVLSYYLVVFGYRSLTAKKMSPHLFDKILSGSVLLGGIVALGYGIFSQLLLFIIFGALTSFLSVTNLKSILRPQKKQWIVGHISGMLGGFIATSTAFLITVAEPQLGFWSWIVPSIIGTPLIILYLRQYKYTS